MNALQLSLYAGHGTDTWISAAIPRQWLCALSQDAYPSPAPFFGCRIALVADDLLGKQGVHPHAAARGVPTLPAQLAGAPAQIDGDMEQIAI
jgi:hypothetical protein